MASSSMKLQIALVFIGSLFFQGTFAEVICENLPSDLCSFAIASSGKRCVLENYKNEQGNLDFTCTTSEVVVERLAGYIETDHCVNSCGVDRRFVGISSDAFFSPDFAAKLCSPACYQSCPNIVDLYFNLAAGEGVFLPALCDKLRSSPHRMMSQVFSSSGDAVAPVSSLTGGEFAEAPENF